MRDEDQELRERFDVLCGELNTTDAEIDIVDRAAAFVLVASGKLSPRDADRLAVLNRWSPFARSPSGVRFDPMQRVHWTLPMVMHWIRHRTLAQEMSPEWRELAQQWELVPDGTWQVRTFSPLTIARYYTFEMLRSGAELARSAREASEEGEREAFMQSALLAQTDTREEIEDAEAQMFRAFEKGDLKATATEERTGIRLDLATSDWPGMRVVHESGPTDRLVRDGKFWRDPFTLASEVMRIWPAAAEVATRQISAQDDGRGDPDQVAAQPDEASAFLLSGLAPEPRDAASRFSDARGKGRRLSEARDLCAQILIHHFDDRLGGLGRKAAVRESVVSDWYSARRKQKGTARLSEPADYKSLIRHTDEALFSHLTR